MVVGYNEASLLEACLESINFCDEIFYTDLGSTDDSIKIAQIYTTNILHKDKKMVPSCEMVQTEVVNYTKHDWVIFIDPDERVDETLKQQLLTEFEKITSNSETGAVAVPWQFYFKKHKLKGTVWGGNNLKHFLVNKHRYQFLPIIHYGRKIIKGFRIDDVVLNQNQTNVLHHYWMNSYKVFIRKHQRYIKHEGKDEYDRDRRVGLKKIFFAPVNEFYFSLITKKGYKDNLIGWFLSAFWAYYKTAVYVGIYKEQKKNKI